MDINAIIEGNGNLYQTIIPEYDLTFSYRLLSLKEYKVFRSLRDGGILPPSLIADRVFERCFIGNVAILSDSLPAGITESIGSLILYLSGDCDDQTLREDIYIARALHPKDTVYEYMRAVIVSIFPYKIEDIESWCRPQFIRNFAIAENIFSKQNPEYELLDLSEIKSAEELAEQQKKSTNHNIDHIKCQLLILNLYISSNPW